jgi:hypothetical protein
MCHGGQFDTILSCKTLEAAWNIEQVFVGISSDEYCWNFLL